MTHISRPTIGNTSAIGRFNPEGPTGYAPVYLDGTHGPTYPTRAEAEADFARTGADTVTKTARIRTSTSSRDYPFNGNEHPTIRTAAGNISIDVQTDGFRPDYNMWPGCGDHHSYKAYLRFEDALTIYGKTYDQISATVSGRQVNDDGPVYGFDRVVISGTTSAADKVIIPAIMPAFTEWIAEQGGLTELFKQARNRSRISHAGYLERQAAENLANATKTRSQIEN